MNWMAKPASCIKPYQQVSPMNKGSFTQPCNLLQFFCPDVALVTHWLEKSQVVSSLHKWGFGKVVVPTALFPCEEQTQVSSDTSWYWVICAKQRLEKDRQERVKTQGEGWWHLSFSLTEIRLFLTFLVIQTSYLVLNDHSWHSIWDFKWLREIG